jgi:hypothetical protein
MVHDKTVFFLLFTGQRTAATNLLFKQVVSLSMHLHAKTCSFLEPKLTI